MAKQRSLILIKHDGVVRGLVGRIIARFEDIGLKILAMKMVWADEKLARNHYKLDEEWAKNVYEKTKKARLEQGQEFPFNDALEYGGMIQSWNINFLREGPVVAIVIEGPHAIEIARKIVGTTEPRQASPGTIRGDYAMAESYELANDKGRVLRNLVHASDSQDNANHEIALWFSEKELHQYPKELDRHQE